MQYVSEVQDGTSTEDMQRQLVKLCKAPHTVDNPITQLRAYIHHNLCFPAKSKPWSQTCRCTLRYLELGLRDVTWHTPRPPLLSYLFPLFGCLLGNTSEFQSLQRNLSISWLWAHPMSTILCMFPHTADNSTIHLQTHLQLDPCLSVKSRPLMHTPRYSASTIIVLLIPLFGHHCGCIYLFVLSVILYITQDSS